MRVIELNCCSFCFVWLALKLYMHSELHCKGNSTSSKKKVGWFCLKFIVSRTSAAAALKNTTKSLRKFKIENPDLNLKYPSISYQHKSAKSPLSSPSFFWTFIYIFCEMKLCFLKTIIGNLIPSEIIFIHQFWNIQHKYLFTKNIVERKYYISNFHK